MSSSDRCQMKRLVLGHYFLSIQKCPRNFSAIPQPQVICDQIVHVIVPEIVDYSALRKIIFLAL